MQHTIQAHYGRSAEQGFRPQQPRCRTLDSWDLVVHRPPRQHFAALPARFGSTFLIRRVPVFARDATMATVARRRPPSSSMSTSRVISSHYCGSLHRGHGAIAADWRVPRIFQEARDDARVVFQIWNKASRLLQALLFRHAQACRQPPHSSTGRLAQSGQRLCMRIEGIRLGPPRARRSAPSTSRPRLA